MVFTSPTWPQHGAADEEAVMAAVRSGLWWRNEGGCVDSFERRFAALEQAPHVLGVTNGTQALELALAGSPVGRGQGVAVPALTFYSSLSAIQRHGAVPVVVDVDPETWNLSLQLPATSADLAGIMPVHFGGVPVDMDAVTDLAGRRDLFVVQDTAHGPGITWGGRGPTAFGGAVCYSFQQSKLVPAGDGGAIAFDSEDAYRRALLLQNCGRAPGDIGYGHTVIASNLRMPELTGALLCAQLERHDELTRRRAEGARVLRDALGAIEGLQLQGGPAFEHTQSNYLVLARLCRPEAGAAERDRLVSLLQAQGVPVNRVFPPLFDLDSYWLGAEAGVGLDDLRERCPNAVRIGETGFGLHHRVLLAPAEDLVRLAGLVYDALRTAEREAA